MTNTSVNLSGIFATPTAYVPGQMVVILLGVPAEMAAQPAEVHAFQAVIETHAREISYFNVQSRLTCANPNINDIPMGIDDQTSDITVTVPEFVGKAVSKLIRHLQRKYFVGKPCADLKKDPFALLAIELDPTKRYPIDAWLMPSFTIDKLSGGGRTLDADYSVENQRDETTISFDLGGVIDQSDDITELAAEILKCHGGNVESIKAEELLKKLFPEGITPVYLNRQVGYAEQLSDLTS